MKFIRNHWYQIMLVAFVCMAFYALFFGENLSMLQKLLLASLMALPLHQFEEYELPGGGPVVINRVFWGEKDAYRNYPGNWNSIMVVNLSAYIFYILALLLPGQHWLGLATMLFNLFQVLGHCLEMNIKGKTWYNPGMATSLVLFLPISITYIWQILPQTTAGVWGGAFAMLVAMLLLTVILPVQLLKNRQSTYIIPNWQIERFEDNSKRFHI